LATLVAGQEPNEEGRDEAAVFDRWRGRYVEDPVDASTWTVRLTIGHHVDVPMTLYDVLDEADCVATVKAWLANLDEDGTTPVDWDGWLELDLLEKGVGQHLTFRADEVKEFTVSPGDTSYDF
jgi:hypothetical protein